MKLKTIFSAFPVLLTPRLRLRQLRLSDKPAILSLYSSPEDLIYYDIEAFTIPVEAEQLILRNRARFTQQRGIRWAITLPPSDVVVGTIGFSAFYKHNESGPLGYDLHRSVWGRGVMSEAVAAVVDFMFDSAELNRIEAFVMPGNTASMRVLEKNGFTKEGFARDFLYFKGQYQDLFMYSILKREWQR